MNIFRKKWEGNLEDFRNVDIGRCKFSEDQDLNLLVKCDSEVICTCPIGSIFVRKITYTHYDYECEPGELNPPRTKKWEGDLMDFAGFVWDTDSLMSTIGNSLVIGRGCEVVCECPLGSTVTRLHINKNNKYFYRVEEVDKVVEFEVTVLLGRGNMKLLVVEEETCREDESTLYITHIQIGESVREVVHLDYSLTTNEMIKHFEGLLQGKINRSQVLTPDVNEYWESLIRGVK